MPFRVELCIASMRRLAEREHVEPDEDLDVIVLPLCDLLEEAGVVFTAGGFGDDRWPVDVRYDLASIVPQLPDIIESLDSGSSVEMDFFEQGIQRTVTIAYEIDRVDLRCRSYGRWNPTVSIEEMRRDDFRKMILELARHFSEAVAAVAPEVVISGPLSEWRSLT